MFEGESVVPRRFARMPLVSLLGLSTMACEPSLDIGSWKCTSAPLFIPPDGSLLPAGKDTTVVPDWHTSFEDGFCGYTEANGFCYTSSLAQLNVVTSPARSGRRAAAFTIDTDEGREGNQTRCVREGTLPRDAYYGAWFYLPRDTRAEVNWNLVHFQGAGDDGILRNLWDVTLVSSTEGTLHPWLRGFVPGAPRIDPAMNVQLPVEQWFSIHVRLLRADEETGTIAMYVNGELVNEVTDILTDDTNWGQWYVGNLAEVLAPAKATVYVDDISIRSSLTDG